jgi:hypothetical protein
MNEKMNVLELNLSLKVIKNFLQLEMRVIKVITYPNWDERGLYYPPPPPHPERYVLVD